MDNSGYGKVDRVVASDTRERFEPLQVLTYKTFNYLKTYLLNIILVTMIKSTYRNGYP